ncbi:MAG: zinc-ribbon domain-containing protein, partial [Pseudomonadota bacterium]
MAEITCPNCQAKYDVPVAALGPKGRDVACANCGHTWHATPDAEKTLVMSQALRAPDPVSGPNPGDSARQSSAGSSGSTVEPPAVPSAPSINQRDRGVATVPVPPPVGMPPSGPSETARPSAGSKPDGAPPV